MQRCLFFWNGGGSIPATTGQHITSPRLPSHLELYQKRKTGELNKRSMREVEFDSIPNSEQRQQNAPPLGFLGENPHGLAGPGEPLPPKALENLSQFLLLLRDPTFRIHPPVPASLPYTLDSPLSPYAGHFPHSWPSFGFSRLVFAYQGGIPESPPILLSPSFCSSVLPPPHWRTPHESHHQRHISMDWLFGVCMVLRKK